MEEKIYPLAILGSGMAGLTASIYASRYRIKHILIGETIGGNAIEAITIENYPGFKKIKGQELINNIKEQVLEYEPDWEEARIETIENKGKYFSIKTNSGKVYKAKYLILALGTKRKELGVPGEKEFQAKGIHHCPTCDGYFYKDKIVAIIGAGDSGATAAFYLADLVKKIYIIDIVSELRAMPFWQEKLSQRKNIEFRLGYHIKEFKGKDRLEEINLESLDGKKENLKIDGVFVAVGGLLNTDIAHKLGLKLDSKGYIETKSTMQTSDPHIFAAGDLTTGSNHFHQMITAASEGAIAANAIYQEVQKK